MNRKSLLCLSIVLLIGITLWGCPKKAEVVPTSEVQPQADKVTALPTEVTPAETRSEELQSIYFDFSKSAIRDDAKDVMIANAEWLKANPKTKIKIEGNCDEHENNWALSKRRATNAKKYLTRMGISAGRISIVGNGLSKPICNEQDETCRGKNRRDDFVVVGQ